MARDLPSPYRALSARDPLRPLRRPLTKIVGTIGPASEDRVGEMLELGLSVARINFSHGTLDEHRRRIGKIRAAAAERQLAVGILADLPGPKMRTGHFPGGSVLLEEGETVRLRSGAGLAEPGEVWIDVAGLAGALRPGHRIALADGQVELLASRAEGDVVEARVRRGGRVADRRGVHLPDSAIAYELPTAQDRELIAFAVEEGIDLLGVSFVGRASELRTIRELAPDAFLVAKIERTAALENLEELLEAADGIMVARGDLGVELELEQLPIAQKALIAAALRAGRFTITATEMLESMITSSRPTRAEVTDVANAVLDGSDAVMLSAETAVGEHPVESVATMARIARAVEHSQRYHDLPRLSFRTEEPSFSNAVAMAGVQVSEALGIEKIVCFTETGNTARLLSRYRPHAEVLALSPNPSAVSTMTCLAGVRPTLVERSSSLEEMLETATEMLEARGLVEEGEQIVFIAGVPPGVARSTNVIKLHRVGEGVKLS